MSRSVRIQYPGAFYHVMARGNRREPIFFDDDDRRYFLKSVGEASVRTGWRVHAWVLMDNHYHLMVETPEPNLIDGMKWLQNTFTRRFNVRHRKWGRVFGDRYKAVIIEGDSGYYCQTLMDYIHLNPVRAGLIRPGDAMSVMDFPWSSVKGGYAMAGRDRPRWLAAAAGLELFGLKDTTAGRRRFVERLDRRAVEEGIEAAGRPVLDEDVDARCSHLRRGWCWGTQEFRERMLALVQGDLRKNRSRGYRSAAVEKAHDGDQAERWLSEGLKAGGLDAAALEKCRGSDPRKVALARLLWERTTVSQDWLAKRLAMRSAANVSQQLKRSASRGGSIPAALVRFIESVER